MSTATPVGAADVHQDRPPVGSAVNGGAETGNAGERGSLTIADRVIERVAGHAATQVEGASAAPRRVLGINVGDARPDDEAAVKARVDGRTATVEATISVEWPTPVPAVAELLRQRIRDDVLRLTDVQVAHIDIDVVSFPAPASRSRRVQ